MNFKRMALSFENRYVVPKDVLKEIFSYISFEQCFFRLRLVCTFWKRTVVEMMHTKPNNRWLKELCSEWVQRKREKNAFFHYDESCYGLYNNYMYQSDLSVMGRLCRCGSPMFFSKCKECNFINCVCYVKKKNEVTCISIQCCFKQQFGLTFDLCLCKVDPCFSGKPKIMHVDAFFASLFLSI
ncbi:MAG: hypothetical protein K2Q45_06770 [Nitrosomonas sp.]|nr:hypothetical protein [Nitrosomonas sp.]